MRSNTASAKRNNKTPPPPNWRWGRLQNVGRESRLDRKEVLTVAKNIVKTMIVGADSKKSAGSSIGRGLVGGALLGPVGLIGGALSGKNKKSTTFLIEYDDGSRDTDTVKTGGMMFNMYAKYLDM